MKISFVSLLGPITIFEEGGKIISLLFSYSEYSDSSPLLEKAKEEIEEYFQGMRKTFDLPLDAKGTEFQKRVWIKQYITYSWTRISIPGKQLLRLQLKTWT